MSDSEHEQRDSHPSGHHREGHRSRIPGARRTSWNCLAALTLVIVLVGPLPLSLPPSARLAVAQTPESAPAQKEAPARKRTSQLKTSSKQCRIGWGQGFFVGHWTPVSVDVEAKSAGEFRVEVIAADPDGHHVRFSSPVQSLQAGRGQLTGLFKAGRFNPFLVIEIHDGASQSGAEPIWKWQPSPQDGELFPTAMAPGTKNVVTVGQPTGFQWKETSTNSPVQKPAATQAPPSGGPTSEIGGIYRSVSAESVQLPVDSRAYDGLSLVAIAGETNLTSEQSAALRDWVGRGGRVFLSLPADISAARRVIGCLAAWMPVSLGPEPVNVREFSELEKYSGKSARIPFAGRLPIPILKMESGIRYPQGQDAPLMVRAPYGMGAVTVLAVDLTPLSKGEPDRPRFADWPGIDSFTRRLVDESCAIEDAAAAKSFRGNKLSSTGVSDLATQLHSVQEHFERVNRASPWMAMGLIGLLMLVLGPLDYLFVHRVLKRPQWTWLTLPLLLTVGTVGVSQMAAQWNGHSLRVNQFNLLDVDVATGRHDERMWTNVYSPETTRRSIRVTPLVSPTATGAASKQDSSEVKTDAVPDADVYAAWSGVPEASFGGMYRTSAVDVGRGEYSQRDDGPLTDVPLLQWATKSLAADSSGISSSLVECDLQAAGAGRLTGTLTHRLPGTIEDWFIVHSNRVYRHVKLRDDAKPFPLKSQQVWRVDQPNVFQRELRAFLTGQVTVAKQKAGATGVDVSHRLTAYDPLSLDPLVVAKTLTFHDEMGGPKYTGLTNRIYHNEDLSHLIRLGRAILFGRLTSPIARVEINGEVVKPDREETFVRIVLPVKVVGSLPQVLESLDPDK